MNKKNVKSVLLALEKMGRILRENEYSLIIELEKEYNIKITEKEFLKLKDPFLWIWVLKPYNKKIFKKEKKRLQSINLSYPIDSLIKKKQLNGKYYIEYLEKTKISSVHDDIFEKLKDNYEITYYNLTRDKWEEVITSKTFNKTEIQIAREIIAENLLFNYNQLK